MLQLLTRPLDGLTSFVLHRALLGDQVRNRQYQAAIHRLVREGDVVVDLGAGTGLLGLFACQAGARHVIAIERGPFRDVGARLFERNGYADRVTWISEDSLEVSLTSKVDVVVTETLGNFAIDEGIVTYAADARERFLQGKGRIMPARLRLYVAATTARPDVLQTALSTSVPAAVRRELLESRWVCSVPVEELMGEPVLLAELDLRTAPAGVDLDARATIMTNRHGTLTGVVGWFVAELADDIELTTAPGAELTHWKQVFFPSPAPQLLDAYSAIEFAVKGSWLGVGTAWSWSLGAVGQVEQFGVSKSYQSVPSLCDLRLSARGRDLHQRCRIAYNGVNGGAE